MLPGRSIPFKIRALQPGYYTDPKVLSGWGWLFEWAFHISTSHFDAVVPLVLTLTGSFFALFYHFTKNCDPKARAVQWFFLLPSIASLVFWFMTAPDLRFAGASFWVLGAGAVTLAAQELGMSFNRKMTRFATFLCLAIVASLMLSVISGKADALRVIIRENNPLRAFLHLSINRDLMDALIIKVTSPVKVFRTLIIIESGGDSGFYAAPHVDLDTFVTRSGLVIYVPKNGKQCWDAPLPCARRPVPNLRLRQEGDMSRGFMCSDPDEIRNPPSCF